VGHQLPISLRYLFAAYPQAMGKALHIVYRAISTSLVLRAGLSRKDGATGAVTLIQRVGRLREQYTESASLDLDPAEVTDATPVAINRDTL
jgi:hypothetical protein